MSSMHCADVREQVGDLDAALAVLLEGALGAEQLGVAVDELILRFAELGRPLLAVRACSAAAWDRRSRGGSGRPP